MLDGPSVVPGMVRKLSGDLEQDNFNSTTSWRLIVTADMGYHGAVIEALSLLWTFVAR